MGVLDLIIELDNFGDIYFFLINKNINNVSPALLYIIKTIGNGANELLEEISEYLNMQYMTDSLDSKNHRYRFTPDSIKYLENIENNSQKLDLLNKMVNESRKFIMPLNTQKEICDRISQIQILDEFEALYFYIKPLKRSQFILNIDSEKLKKLIYVRDPYFRDLRHNWLYFKKIVLRNKFGLSGDKITEFVKSFNSDELSLMMAQNIIEETALFMNKFLAPNIFIDVLRTLFKKHNFMDQLSAQRCAGFLLLLRLIDPEKQILVSMMPEIQGLREVVGVSEQELLSFLIRSCYIKDRAVINNFLKSWDLFDEKRPFNIEPNDIYSDIICSQVNQLQSVAILDIDKTIVYNHDTHSDMTYISPMLNGMVEEGITNLYLYTARLNQELEIIKLKLKDLGFIVYGVLTAEGTITALSETDVKKNIIAKFVQNNLSSFRKIIIKDLSEEVKNNEQPLITQSMSTTPINPFYFLKETKLDSSELSEINNCCLKQ